jgi:hypothetical protein
MRGSGAVTDFPFRVIVRDVEKQYRLRLPGEFAGLTKWLSASEDMRSQSLGVVGPLGGMQLIPLDCSVSQTRNTLRSELLELPAQVDEVTAAFTDAVRYLATAWYVDISYERKKDRFTLVLPEEARLLGVVPHQGESAVIFATGQIRRFGLRLNGANMYKK